MSFVPKPNSGMLWTNDYKQTPGHPDYRGDLHLDKEMLLGLIKKAEGNLVKIQVSAWNKNISNKDAISLAAAEPYIKTDRPAPKRSEPDNLPDEDIPF
jgi:hypothetical protein